MGLKGAERWGAKVQRGGEHCVGGWHAGIVGDLCATLAAFEIRRHSGHSIGRGPLKIHCEQQPHF